MTFFARPDLSNEQFKQLSGSILTLTGTTQIASLSGFSLTNGAGTYIPVAADSELTLTHGMSLAYDSTVNRIRLMDISGGTGTNCYLGASPTTVSVGGMPVDTEISGSTFQDILQCILVPALDANTTNPSLSTTVSSPTPLLSAYEMGTTFNYTVQATYCAGIVNPTYEEGTGDVITPDKPRAGLPTCFLYTINNTPYCTNLTSSCVDAEVTLPYTVQQTNQFRVFTFHESGDTVYNSAGIEQLSGFSAGSVTSLRLFNGLYPWFYGSSETAPTANQALIDDGTPVVGSSATNITVPNYNVSGEYIWFAVPVSQGSTSVAIKTKWQGGNNISNNGVIPGDLFAAPTTVSIESPSSLWAARDYRIYISNYPTSIDYSMTFSN